MILSSAALVISAVIVVLAVYFIVMPYRRAVGIACYVSLASALLIPFQRAPVSWSIRVLACLLIFAPVVIIASRSGVWRAVSAASPLFLFIGVLGISSIVHLSTASAVQWCLVAAGIVGGAVLAHVMVEARMATRILRFLAALGCAASVYSVFEVLMGVGPLWVGARIYDDGTSAALVHPFISEAYRAQATLGHPLALAFFLLIVLAILCSFRLWVSPWPASVIAASVMVGIFATGSRSALFVGLVLVLFRLTSSLPGVRLVAFALGAACVVFLAQSEVSRLFSEFSSTGSYTHRIGALDAIGNLLRERAGIDWWLGSGPAGVSSLYDLGLLQSDGFQAVDNQLVYMLAVSGVLGCFAFIYGVVVLWRRCSRAVWPVLFALATQLFVFDFIAWFSCSLLGWFLLIFCSELDRSPDMNDSGGVQDWVLLGAGRDDDVERPSGRNGAGTRKNWTCSLAWFPERWTVPGTRRAAVLRRSTSGSRAVAGSQTAPGR